MQIFLISRKINIILNILHKTFDRLIGHLTKSPSFALDWAKNSYRIGSGSKDTNVLIWDIDDY